MKRLNFILIAETLPDGALEFKDGDLNPSDIDEETMAKLVGLEDMIRQNPELANDPEIKPLIEIAEGMKRAFPAKETSVTTTTTTTAAAATTTGKDGEKKDKLLSDLPFFGEGVEAIDAKGLKIDKLPDFVKDNFKIDTSSEDWVEKLIGLVSKGDTDAYEGIKKDYDDLKGGLESLPKELSLAVADAIKGKDWRTRIGAAVTLDLSKDFNTLTTAQKISTHNFFFPEDKIEDGADIADKSISKSIKVAESKFNSEKQIYTTNLEQAITRADNEKKALLQSADKSIAALKKDFPSFKASDLASIERVIKKDGIWSLFLDESGNFVEGAAKMIAFALNGDKILKAAVAIAESKGSSKGKAEVIQSSGSRGTKAEGADNLTDEEKRMMKQVQEAEKTGVGVGNNPY